MYLAIGVGISGVTGRGSDDCDDLVLISIRVAQSLEHIQMSSVYEH